MLRALGFSLDLQGIIVSSPLVGNVLDRRVGEVGRGDTERRAARAATQRVSGHSAACRGRSHIQVIAIDQDVRGAGTRVSNRQQPDDKLIPVGVSGFVGTVAQ